MRRRPPLTALILALALLPVPSFAQTGEKVDEKQWTSAGVPLKPPLPPRAGFYLAFSPQAGIFFQEFRRAAGGAGLRVGYGIDDRWSVYLKGDWTITQHVNVLFDFVDLAPHVSYLVTDDLYLLAGGGVTWATHSSGTTVKGFSTTSAVSRLGYYGAGGLGRYFINGSGISLAGEAEAVYRRIDVGNFIEPVVRLLLIYRF